MKGSLAAAIALGGVAVLWAVNSPWFTIPARHLIIGQAPTFTTSLASVAVTGHFELTEPSPLSSPFLYMEAIPSVGTGGACLLTAVTDAAGNPKSCNPDKPPDDCIAPPMPRPVGWSPYCHPTEKTCWLKKGESWCNKSGHYTPPQIWTVGVSEKTNVSPAPGKRGSQWRVLACTNGFDPKAKTTNYACGGDPGEKKQNWGPIIVAR